MLSTWEAIKNRRSIRKFASDDVSDEIINQILEAARLAPSASNSQPWCFLVVRDAEKRKKLRRVSLNQRFVDEAPVVIIAFVNLERSSKEAKQARWQEVQDSDIFESLSGPFGERDYWERRIAATEQPSREEILPSAMANTYIAITQMILMATALGLGTCWLGGFTPVDINLLFDLPNTLVPVAVVPVGYAAGKIPLQRPRLSAEEILVKPRA
jgi:nitroreductase